MDVILCNFDILTSFLSHCTLTDIPNLLSVNKLFNNQISSIFIRPDIFVGICKNYSRPNSKPNIIFNKFGRYERFTPHHFDNNFFKYIIYLLCNCRGPLFINNRITDRIEPDIVRDIVGVIGSNDLIKSDELWIDPSLSYLEALFPNDTLIDLALYRHYPMVDYPTLTNRGIKIRLGFEEEVCSLIPLDEREIIFYKRLFLFLQMITNNVGRFIQPIRNILFIPDFNPFSTFSSDNALGMYSMCIYCNRGDNEYTFRGCATKIYNQYCFYNEKIREIINFKSKEDCTITLKGEKYIVYIDCVKKSYTVETL